MNNYNKNNNIYFFKYNNINFSKRIILKKNIRLAYIKKFQRFNIWNQDQYFKLKNFIFQNKKKKTRNRQYYIIKLQQKNKLYWTDILIQNKLKFRKKPYRIVTKTVIRPKNKNLYAGMISSLIVDSKDNNKSNILEKFLTKKSFLVSSTTTGLPFKLNILHSYYYKLNELWRTRFHMYILYFVDKFKFFFPKISIRQILLYLFMGSLNYNKNYYNHLNSVNKYRVNWLKKKQWKFILKNLKKNIFFFKFFFLNYSLNSFNNLYSMDSLWNLNFNYYKNLKNNFYSSNNLYNLEYKFNSLIPVNRNLLFKGNDKNINYKLYNSLLLTLPLNNIVLNKNIKNQKKILKLQLFKHTWFLNKLKRYKGSRNWWLSVNKVKLNQIFHINYPISYLKYKNKNIILNNFNMLNFIAKNKKKKNKIFCLLNKFKNYHKPLNDNFVISVNNFWIIWKIISFWINKTKKTAEFFDEKLNKLTFINSLDIDNLKMKKESLEYYFNHYSIFQKYGADILTFKYFKSNAWKQRFNVKLNLRTSSQHFNIWNNYFKSIVNFNLKYDLLKLYSKVIFLDYFKFNYKNLIINKYLNNYINNASFNNLSFKINYYKNKNMLKSLQYSFFNIMPLKTWFLNKNVLFLYSVKYNNNLIINNYLNLIFVYLYIYVYNLNKLNLNSVYLNNFIFLNKKLSNCFKNKI